MLKPRRRRHLRSSRSSSYRITAGKRDSVSDSRGRAEPDTCCCSHGEPNTQHCTDAESDCECLSHTGPVAADARDPRTGPGGPPDRVASRIVVRGGRCVDRSFGADGRIACRVGVQAVLFHPVDHTGRMVNARTGAHRRGGWGYALGMFNVWCHVAVSV